MEILSIIWYNTYMVTPTTRTITNNLLESTTGGPDSAVPEADDDDEYYRSPVKDVKTGVVCRS